MTFSRKQRDAFIKLLCMSRKNAAENGISVYRQNDKLKRGSTYSCWSCWRTALYDEYKSIANSKKCFPQFRCSKNNSFPNYVLGSASKCWKLVKTDNLSTLRISPSSDMMKIAGGLFGYYGWLRRILPSLGR